MKTCKDAHNTQSKRVGIPQIVLGSSELAVGQRRDALGQKLAVKQNPFFGRHESETEASSGKVAGKWPLR